MFASFTFMFFLCFSLCSQLFFSLSDLSVFLSSSFTFIVIFFVVCFRSHSFFILLLVYLCIFLPFFLYLSFSLFFSLSVHPFDHRHGRIFQSDESFNVFTCLISTSFFIPQKTVCVFRCFVVLVLLHSCCPSRCCHYTSRLL